MRKSGKERLGKPHKALDERCFYLNCLSFIMVMQNFSVITFSKIQQLREIRKVSQILIYLGFTKMARRETKNITGLSRIEGVPYHDEWVCLSVFLAVCSIIFALGFLF